MSMNDMCQHWVARYIGIPFAVGGRTPEEGLDCYGLVRCVYLKERGIVLPNYLEDFYWKSGENRIFKTTLCLTSAIHNHEEQDWHEIDQAQEFCVVAMSQKNAIHHVGLWTNGGGGKVIHVLTSRVTAESLKMLRLQGIQSFRYFVYGLSDIHS